ncbi:interleukin-1 receptor-associated kinase 1 isoform X3 [Fundulus heteroclitus]|uniref:interleukin-1 receptor-associated kinase 1 isoform X3 n=1 Tax=Fundulus heteroclitus TaxID=8078 RepID=UPI00165B725E|nr:interleukin-1 receptor-associated kinase 1 isoform X3 [Fundulus heteroclitus]
MSGGALRDYFLFQLPPSVQWEFCRVMDGLLDLDWTRFASEVLKDQTAVRLADRRERRTDWVMNQWESRNGRVGELIDLLESLQLFRPRDVILTWTRSDALPPLPPPPPPPPYEPPAQPTVDCSAKKEERPLPGPAPPPGELYSEHQQAQETGCASPDAAAAHDVAPPSFTGVICWTYEEVHDGTQGFSPSLQVGEGGFGVVYRASLRNMDCAVKRLRQACVVLSWALRVSIVEGAAAALQFLHHPPVGQEQLIHGDVKSSNILLDQHWVPKLSDFGLARCVPRGPAGCSTQTQSVGRTTTVRGTLAYLPEEYVRRGELSTGLDVYSFGVVLLEVLTGRRALEQDGKSGDRYLKDLVEDDDPNSAGPEAWRRHLDQRLTAGGAAEPDGYLRVAALARKSLSRQRKKRPAMTEVFHQLRELRSSMRRSSSSPRLPPPPPQSFPRPPRSLDSCVTAVSHQLSELAPSQQNLPPSSSSSSSSSSSFGAFTPPRPLHSSSLGPPSLCPPSLSLAGPCETDESRGFSQYELRSQFRSDGSGCGSDHQNRAVAAASRLSQPSVPTEDQYNYPPQPGGPGPGEAARFSPAGSLQSTSAGLSVLVNPSKQRLLEKKSQYDEGRIRTPELLSLVDLYGARSSEELRGPEESDELEYLPAGRS